MAKRQGKRRGPGRPALNHERVSCTVEPEQRLWLRRIVDVALENQMDRKRRTGERQRLVDTSAVLRAVLAAIMDANPNLSRCASEQEIREAIASRLRRR